jgi:hypothetical protein
VVEDEVAGVGEVEFVLGVLALSALIAMWLVGSRRQPKADGEQRAVIRELEGQRVTADITLGLAPTTTGMHVIATTTFVLGPLDDRGSRVRVSNVQVGQSDGRDPKVAAAELERDGLDVRNILTISGPDGELRDFGVVQYPRRDENGSSR